MFLLTRKVAECKSGLSNLTSLRLTSASFLLKRECKVNAFSNMNYCEEMYKTDLSGVPEVTQECKNHCKSVEFIVLDQLDSSQMSVFVFACIRITFF